MFAAAVRSAAIAVALTLCTACGAPHDSAAHASAQTQTTASAAPDFREFSAWAEQGAPELWGQIAAKPFDAGLRRQLAELYRARGYRAAAEFVSASAAAIESNEVSVPRVDRPHWWSCDPATPEDLALINDTQEQLSSGDVDGAYVRIAEAMKTRGGICDVAIKYAYVVLFRDLRPGTTGLPEWEPAFRTAITGGEELRAGDANLAGAYELAAAHFLAAGDLPSAYTAMSAALARTEENAGYGYTQRQERVAKARDQLVAARAKTAALPAP